MLAGDGAAQIEQEGAIALRCKEMRGKENNNDGNDNNNNNDDDDDDDTNNNDDDDDNDDNTVAANSIHPSIMQQHTTLARMRPHMSPDGVGPQRMEATCVSPLRSVMARFT
jgi:TATA-binding protein-associated factor Taf7